MQELRSIEILDKEIQAEARKKVENILKKANDEAQALLNGVDEKVATAKKDKETFYNKKIESYSNDLNASVPLEKQRFEVTFIQDSLINSINDYLQTLSEDKILELLTQKINLAELVGEKKINAFVYGLNLVTAKAFLEKKIGSNLNACEKTEFSKMVYEDDIGLKNNQGIILESEDRSLRCRLTLVEVFKGILDKNRAELSAALFENGGNL